MPLGPDGLPLFYPTKSGGFTYFQSDDILDDSNFNGEGDVTDSSGGEWTFETDGPTSVQIFKNSDTANSIGGCDMDFAETAERGYGYRADDPRDIELKFLVKFVSADSDEGFAIEGPTGRHSGDGCCQGFAYKLDINFQTSPVEWRFRKEMFHVSNSNDPTHDVWTTSLAPDAFIGGDYVGIGYVHYIKPGGANSGHNTDDSVVLEAWFNPDPENNPTNWTMIKRTEDKGGWGNDGDACGGDDDQIGVWSNSNFRLKSNVDGGEFQFKHLSLREIDPFGTFEDDPEEPEPGEETEPTQVQGVFSFKWDINHLRVSPCAGAGGGGAGGSAIFYNISATSETELSNTTTFQNRTRGGEQCQNSSSPIYNKLIKQLDVPLKKVGTPGATPVINAKIWSSGGSVIYTSPTTIAPNALTTSFTTQSFDFSTNTHLITTGDVVGVEYITTSSTNYVIFGYSGNTVANTIYVNREAGAWEPKPTTRDFACTMWQ